MTMHETLTGYLDQRAGEDGDSVWLRDRAGDEFTEWTWGQSRRQIAAMAARLEQDFGKGVNMAILSRNRAHWFFADYAIITSGNVTIPMFTTLPGPTAKYVLEFSDTKVLFLATGVVSRGGTLERTPGKIKPNNSCWCGWQGKS